MARPARFFASVDGADASLLIYDQIGASWFSEGVTAKAVSEALDEFRAKGAKTLHVYVNSPGGDVFEGNAVYNVLRRWEGRKVVHIDGLAASMASVVAMVGDEIRIAANGMVMIHEPWGVVMGDAEEMRERAKLLDELAVNLRGTYERRTKQPADEIAKLMAAETWMGAEQAKSLGFVDVIDDDEDDRDEDEAFARAPAFDKFTKTPDQARRLLARAAVRRSATCGMGPQQTPAQPAEEQHMSEKNEAPAAVPAITLTQEQFNALVSRTAPAEPATATVSGPVASVMSAATSATAPVIAKYNTPKALVGREDRSDDEAGSAKKVRALRFARFNCAAVLAKEIGCQPADAAEMLGYNKTAEIIARGAAMQEGDATTGGTFAPTELQQGFIDMLDERPGSIRSLIPAGNIVRSSQATIQFPTITSGVAGGWVGENPSTGNPEALGTGSKTLVAKKQRVEVVISRDLLRGASNIDSVVLEKLLTRSGQLDDLAIVEGTGSAFQPRGLEVIVPSANTEAMTATPDYADARTDLIYLAKRLAMSKVPKEAGFAYILPEQALWGLMGYGNAVGEYPFADMILAGRLLGKPFAASTLIGTDKVYGFAPGEAIFFERLGMTVERDTTYHTAAGVAVSASSSDQVVIRLWRQVDFDMQHDASVSVKTGITWGA